VAAAQFDDAPKLVYYLAYMNMENQKILRFLKVVGVIGLSLLTAGLYWYGAGKQLTQVNIDMTATDQSAYMAYARALVDSNYTAIGDRNRMPVYPILQSLFYQPGMSDEAFFMVANMSISFCR